jgi:hypothetical protein
MHIIQTQRQKAHLQIYTNEKQSPKTTWKKIMWRTNSDYNTYIHGNVTMKHSSFIAILNKKKCYFREQEGKEDPEWRGVDAVGGRKM